jgi:hypothetical protein
MEDPCGNTSCSLQVFWTSQGNDFAYGISVLCTSKKDVKKKHGYKIPDWLGLRENLHRNTLW